MIDNNDKILEALVVNSKDRKVQIWKRNGLSFMLNKPETIIQKLEYIHNNPLQTNWCLSEKPEDYYHSSAYYYKNEIDNFGFLTNIRNVLM